MAKMPGRMPRSERYRSEATPVGINIGLGVAVVLTAVIVAALVPASAGAWRLVPVAVALVVAGGATADPTAMAYVATAAYLLAVGFLVNRYGVLTWDGMGDIYRLVVIMASAGFGLLLGAGWRRSRRPPPLIVPPAWVAQAAAQPRASQGTNKEEAPDS